jgi:hypothetical protein
MLVTQMAALTAICDLTCALMRRLYARPARPRRAALRRYNAAAPSLLRFVPRIRCRRADQAQPRSGQPPGRRTVGYYGKQNVRHLAGTCVTGLRGLDAAQCSRRARNPPVQKRRRRSGKRGAARRGTLKSCTQPECRPPRPATKTSSRGPACCRGTCGRRRSKSCRRRARTAAPCTT